MPQTTQVSPSREWLDALVCEREELGVIFARRRANSLHVFTVTPNSSQSATLRRAHKHRIGSAFSSPDISVTLQREAPLWAPPPTQLAKDEEQFFHMVVEKGKELYDYHSLTIAVRYQIYYKYLHAGGLARCAVG